MGNPIADMFVRIGADLSDFQKGMERVSKDLSDMGDKLQSIGKKMSLAITVPLVGVSGAAIKMASDMEQSRIAFTTLLGSAEKADAFLRDLFDFARTTPFEFNNLQETSKRLLALGFESQQIIPVLNAVGNAAAALGGGSALIDRITLALGQMQAKGKVSAQEMNQLAEAGIPAWDILARKIGVSIPEAMKKAENGAISAATAVPAILDDMNTRFSGLMDKQSKTVAGIWSNFQDQLGGTLREIGADIIEAFDVKGIIAELTDGLQTLTLWFQSLTPEAKQLVLVTGALVAGIGPLLLALGTALKLLPLLTGGFGLLATAITSPITGFVAMTVGIGALAAGITAFIVQNLDPLGKMITGLGQIFLSLIAAIKDLGSALSALGQIMMGVITLDFSQIRSGWDSLKSAVVSSVNAMGSEIDQGWQNIVDGASESFGNMKDDVGGAIDKVKKAWTTARSIFTWPEAIKDTEKLKTSLDKIPASQKQIGDQQATLGREIRDMAKKAFGDYQEWLGRKILEEARATADALGKLEEWKGRKALEEAQAEFYAIGALEEEKGRMILRKAQETQRNFHILATEAIRATAEAIKGIWNGTTVTFKQAWTGALDRFTGILAEMVEKAIITGTEINLAMASATAGITLVFGLLASVFGGKGSGATKSKIQQATEDFLAEIKRALNSFENDVLSTLDNLLRIAGRGREALARLSENITASIAAVPQTNTLRLPEDTRNRLENLKKQIIDNARVLENAILDEYRLKRDLIMQTIDLLKREKAFASGIDQSIKDVTRATFSKSQLFNAQLGDINTLKSMVAASTREDKIAFLAQLKDAFMAAWGTAQDLFGDDPAALSKWQDFVITGLKDIKASGTSEFDQLIKVNMDALGISQRQLDTQKQLEDHLAKIEDAVRSSLGILYDIVEGKTLSQQQIQGLQTQLNIVGFATGGIATGPTLAMVGESGPEAIVPLDKLDSVAGGGGQTIIIQLDGKTIARKTVQHMPSVLRLQGVPV